MRLVIRNKDKLIESFGEDYYNLLLESVKAYEYNSDDRYSSESACHQFINIPSAQSEVMFKFAIVKEIYDVIVLGYYSAIN
jgi:hypothetical protein